MTFPNFSFTGQAYSQGPGTTGLFWPIVSDRNPTVNDVYYGPQTYKVGQIWFNSVLEEIWYLDSFSNAPTASNPTGQLQATWISVVTNTTQILSLSDNAGTQVFPSSISASPPSNIQITGQLNEQVGFFPTVVANPASHIIEINPMSPARWIVDPLSTASAPNGTHTSIQAAINAASAGDTIMVMPGTYGGSITLNTSVNITAFNDDVIGNVIITGPVTLNNTATGIHFSFSGIRFQASSGTLITSSGTVTQQLFFTRCALDVSGTALGISFTNSAINSEIVFLYCIGDASDAGSSIFQASGLNSNGGLISFTNCNFSNGAGTGTPSTTANTISAGTVSFTNSVFSSPTTTSSTAALSAFSTNFPTGNTTCLTIGGSGTNTVEGCTLNSGTAVAASIGSTLTMTLTTISSSHAPALSGAGTINYGGLVFTSNSTNSVSTKNLLTVT
jgi:hypothetical protein